MHGADFDSGKGTTVRHGVAEAGAIFPSASVNGQARRVALIRCVLPSRMAGDGERAAPLRPARMCAAQGYLNYSRLSAAQARGEGCALEGW